MSESNANPLSHLEEHHQMEPKLSPLNFSPESSRLAIIWSRDEAGQDTTFVGVCVEPQADNSVAGVFVAVTGEHAGAVVHRLTVPYAVQAQADARARDVWRAAQAKCQEGAVSAEIDRGIRNVDILAAMVSDDLRTRMTEDPNMRDRVLQRVADVVSEQLTAYAAQRHSECKAAPSGEEFVRMMLHSILGNRSN